jgi:hypothetical protein
MDNLPKLENTKTSLKKEIAELVEMLFDFKVRGKEGGR